MKDVVRGDIVGEMAMGFVAKQLQCINRRCCMVILGDMGGEDAGEDITEYYIAR